MIERHLFGGAAIDEQEAWVFETGSNRWRAFDRFPPAARPAKLYLREAGAASFDPPTQAGADEYLSDPARPVPHSARPQKPFWEFTDHGLADDYGLWRVADQRFTADRPDVAQWVTPPLDHDVTTAGAVSAHLYASTTGTDCDFVVKLIDVFPDDKSPMAGYQLMVAVEVMPARFRNGFARAVATVPGKLERYDIDLRWLDHQFRKGHRIMVSVQSTWFPLIERNPQRRVDLFAATPADFQKATQRIARGPRTPSHIELPLIDEPASAAPPPAP
jgi:putative CocE/NonD family hydrolase